MKFLLFVFFLFVFFLFLLTILETNIKYYNYIRRNTPKCQTKVLELLISIFYPFEINSICQFTLLLMAVCHNFCFTNRYLHFLFEQ